MWTIWDNYECRPVTRTVYFDRKQAMRRAERLNSEAGESRYWARRV